jgi:hypothetical protein
MKLFGSKVRFLSSQQLVYSNTRHQYILYHNIISNAKFQYAI